MPPVSLLASLGLVGLMLLVSPAPGASAPPPLAAPMPGPATPPPPDPAQQLATLRGELAAAQREIVRLRTLGRDREDLEAQLQAARARNARLVAIGQELIAAYGQRYRHGRFLPFDQGRRRFEETLQATGDRLYDNRWDAGPRASGGPDGAPAPSSTGAKP